jgi:acetoacetate decarboxylase
LSGTAEWIAHKLIPSVSLQAPPEVDQLTTTTLTNAAVREVHKGPASLSFGDSPADRFAQIPIKKVLGGFYYRTDFTLGDGAIAHNYLR